MEVLEIVSNVNRSSMSQQMFIAEPVILSTRNRAQPSLEMEAECLYTDTDAYTNENDRQEYEQLMNAFFNGSKRSMSQHISKFL